MLRIILRTSGSHPPDRMRQADPNSLKTYPRAIYRKLGAESREEAMIRGCEGGLI